MPDKNTESQFDLIKTAAQFLNGRFGQAPKVAVVLGSGLSAFAETLQNAESISTAEVPGAVSSSVIGHAGRLVVGYAGQSRAAILAGRVHGYEGHSPSKVVFLLRALKIWGVQNFILTNAAGSTSKSYKPGTLVLLRDHLNLTSQNPLIGKELFGGPRFPDMSDAYSKEWRKRVSALSKKLKIPLKEGVYAGVLGPSFETAAEIKMFARFGATMVGMSTVWETIALHQMGAKILGISCITNFGTGVTQRPLGHDEVIEETQKIQKKFNLLMTNILEKTVA